MGVLAVDGSVELMAARCQEYRCLKMRVCLQLWLHVWQFMQSSTMLAVFPVGSCWRVVSRRKNITSKLASWAELVGCESLYPSAFSTTG
jgi:hypothetical protein